MRQLFISDLHLDEAMPGVTQAFFSFLDSRCRDADQLYILGDFFEVWLGDDDCRAFNEEILARLAACPAEKYIMQGNRDFLIGDLFCQKANATLLADPTILLLASGPVLLMHGDSLCTQDTEYMALRQELRSAQFQASFLNRPLTERAALAQKMRGASRAHTREVASDIMDVTSTEVVKSMTEAGVNTLIHGHTHRPGVHEVSLGEAVGHRYVLGDWHTSTQYLEVTEGQMALQVFDFAQPG